MPEPGHQRGDPRVKKRRETNPSMDGPNKDLHEPVNKSRVIGSTHAGSHERREDVAVARREFLGVVMATSLFAGTRGSYWAAEQTSGIPYRTLGRTGENGAILGLGG